MTHPLDMADQKAQKRYPIYMDYQATTPCDPRVVEVMLPWFHESFGNPHAAYHAYGWRAEEAVNQARQQVADVLGAKPKEIIFTSGATEANNLAIKGVAEAYQQSERNHIITLSTEHKCVREACRVAAERHGYRLTELPVQPNGIVDLDRYRGAVDDHTLLVSAMLVNNEIGVIQPIQEMAAIANERGALFHCDAAQAFGKLPIDVNALQVDLLSLSSHKSYGPPGIGALYIRRRPKVHIEPQIHGGGQERGYRSGTLPAPLIIGLGKAASIAAAGMDAETKRLEHFYQQFVSATVDKMEGVTLNGDHEQRFVGNINLSFAGLKNESLIMALKKLAVSSGSACASGSAEPSYVLRAIGLPEDTAHGAIRFGIGRFTTQEEIDEAVDLLQHTVQRLRQLD